MKVDWLNSSRAKYTRRQASAKFSTAMKQQTLMRVNVPGGVSLISRRTGMTTWTGGIGNSRNPPRGSACWWAKRTSLAPPEALDPEPRRVRARCCWERPTICLRLDNAAAILGVMSRREVRSTACSRNSEAKTVCAVREELPSKAEESRSVAPGVLLSSSSSSSSPWPRPAVVVEGERLKDSETPDGGGGCS